VIDLWVFLFFLCFFFLRFFLGGGWFGVLPFDVFVWLPRKKCVNIFLKIGIGVSVFY
jgi:hypothetical protein